MSPAKEKLDTSIRSRPILLSAESFLLLACTFLAFLIRCYFVPPDTVINGDGAYYTILGERFVSGDFSGGISAYWSPLYSVLTGFSSLLFADRDFSGRFVSLVAGALLIIPAYFLIRDLFGRNAAYLGSILLIVHPFLIKSSGWVMTESVYTLILTTCILSGWRALSKMDWRLFLITGLLIGIAFLTKPEAIGYLLLMLVLLVAAKFIHRRISFARTGFNCLLLSFGFSFFFLPYYLYLHQKTGVWTLSQKIAVNLPAADFDGDLLSLTRDKRMTVNDRLLGDDYDTKNLTEVPAVKPAPAPAPFSFSGVASDASILGSKAVILLRHQLRNYFLAILPIPFALFAIAGFFLGTWSWARAEKEIFLTSFVMCTLLGYAASSVELRYLFPLIPILIAWAARGIAEFSDTLSRSLRTVLPLRRAINPMILSICLLILLLGALILPFSTVLQPDDITNVPFEEKQAGLWITEHSDEAHPVIISSHITPAFYAHAKHLYLPKEDLSTVVEYARFRRADYLIFSERRKNDAAAFAAATDGPLRDLDLVYEDRQNLGHQILVYQLNN